MPKKNQARKRHTPIDSARIPGVGRLTLIRYGTQFFMAIDGLRLESVRTEGSARRMFKSARTTLRGKKVMA